MWPVKLYVRFFTFFYVFFKIQKNMTFYVFLSCCTRFPQHWQPLLPDRPDNAYTLRQRPHGNKRLINKTVDLNDNDFIVRAMY